MLYSFLAFSLLSLVAPGAFAAPSRHHKRFTGVRATFYDITVGQVACGGLHGANENVVAMTSAIFTQATCGKVINISGNGKTVAATVVDACPGCGADGIDLTQGLFEQFGDTSLGVLSLDWDFADGGAAPAPAPAPAAGVGGGSTVTVNAGDSCSAIASAHSISVADIMSKNPSVNAGCTNLQVGQTLNL